MLKFKKLLTDCCDACTEGTCQNYAYSLAFLEKNIDITDPAAAIKFLSDQTLSRRQNGYTSLKVYYRRHLHDLDKCAMLDQPLLDTKNEIQQKRKNSDSKAIKKNWVDFACLKNVLKSSKL